MDVLCLGKSNEGKNVKYKSYRFTSVTRGHPMCSNSQKYLDTKTLKTVEWFSCAHFAAASVTLTQKDLPLLRLSVLFLFYFSGSSPSLLTSPSIEMFKLLIQKILHYRIINLTLYLNSAFSHSFVCTWRHDMF